MAAWTGAKVYEFQAVTDGFAAAAETALQAIDPAPTTVHSIQIFPFGTSLKLVMVYE